MVLNYTLTCESCFRVTHEEGYELDGPSFNFQESSGLRGSAGWASLPGLWKAAELSRHQEASSSKQEVYEGGGCQDWLFNATARGGSHASPLKASLTDKRYMKFMSIQVKRVCCYRVFGNMHSNAFVSLLF